MSIVLSDFILKEKTPISIIEQYRNQVPAQVVEVWETFGFGSINNGYLRVINPDTCSEILKDTYKRYQMAIPLFTTAMGDILVWEDQYLLLLNYRKHEVNVVAKNFKFFLNDIFDDYYLKDAMDWLPYSDAMKKYGIPDFEECFGYVPLLGSGGTEKVENLKKVKLTEHIYIITEFMGSIE